MSRALDKDVTASLSSTGSTLAYKAISEALAQQENLLEIEILGKSHALEPGTFLLQDGNAVAISKLGLVQAFFAARIIFQDRGNLSPEDLLSATSVILLMDPEHLTAANARKRLVLSQSDASPGRLLEFIRKDQYFIDSLLTSRLHRHTKSPTLWSHRRWLVDTAGRHGIDAKVAGGLKRVVIVAGERHPRNYYAWCHARWLTGLVPPEQQARSFEELVEVTKGWCCRNHTDISGWSFLYFLLVGLENRAICSLVFEEVTKLAITLQWNNESVWHFLRTLAAFGAIRKNGVDLFGGIRWDLIEARVDSPEGGRLLEKARLLCEKYQPPA